MKLEDTLSSRQNEDSIFHFMQITKYHLEYFETIK